jgi:hypothetical protein
MSARPGGEDAPRGSRADGVRLFLTVWLVCALGFATNIVREHYPAFALVDHGSLRVDEYVGLHSDIFVHSDGHAYIDNQVGASFVAAVPLFLFDPLLDRLEARRKRELADLEARGAAPDAAFDSEYPGRRAFFAEVRRRGLDQRFGAAAALTAVLAMAPLAALCAVLVRRRLLRQGVPPARAVWLALCFALGTPVLYRAATLSNNLLVMATTLGALLALWDLPASRARRALAGLCAAGGLVFDYSACVLPPVLWAWYVLRRRSDFGHAGHAGWRAGWRIALAESLWIVLGGIPPVLFLWCTQWLQFGHPFLPAQHWMTPAHFTDRGWRGLTPPDLGLFLENLTSPNWGLVAFAPLLLVALVPTRTIRGPLVLPRSHRRFVWSYTLLFLVFCSMNQYARMQWNTGFRYLLPLVPLLFLAACDTLARLPRGALAGLSVVVVLHTWVLSSVRYLVQPDELATGNAVRECWRRFLTEGPTFPWLTTLRQATPDPASIVHAAWLPYALPAAAAAALAAIWRVGPRPAGQVEEAAR